MSHGPPLWRNATKADRVGAQLADRHYSRRKVGSPQFMPPGQTLVLVGLDEMSVFGWWRPHPNSGLKAMNGLDGWTCTIFRREAGPMASDLILAAERVLSDQYNCGPDGLLTYVWDSKLRSTNPGYCFKAAGWTVHPRKPRSADGRKTLLWKPFDRAGIPTEASYRQTSGGSHDKRVCRTRGHERPTADGDVPTSHRLDVHTRRPGPSQERGQLTMARLIQQFSEDEISRAVAAYAATTDPRFKDCNVTLMITRECDRPGPQPSVISAQVTTDERNRDASEGAADG